MGPESPEPRPVLERPDRPDRPAGAGNRGNEPGTETPWGRNRGAGPNDWRDTGSGREGAWPRRRRNLWATGFWTRGAACACG